MPLQPGKIARVLPYRGFVVLEGVVVAQAARARHGKLRRHLAGDARGDAGGKPERCRRHVDRFGRGCDSLCAHEK